MNPSPLASREIAREEQFRNVWTNELNDVFDRFFGRQGETPEFWGASFPPANISETDDNVVVTLQVPGMDAKDIELSLHGEVLTLKGEKKQEKEEKGKKFHRVERSYGSFVRSFSLPESVDEAAVKAEYKDGVLNLHLPKSEKVKPKAIDVKVA